MMAKTEIDTTNRLLSRYSGEPLMVLLTGASGAGKSHLASALEKQLDLANAHVAYFDSIGIPDSEQMVSEYGSGEKWQEAKTHEWIADLAAKQDKALIVFEGQYNPKLALEGCKKAGVSNYILCVVHCDEAVREKRLSVNREQPELINEDMRNWARFLHAKTVELEGEVLDTSQSRVSENINALAALINRKLRVAP